MLALASQPSGILQVELYMPFKRKFQHMHKFKGTMHCLRSHLSIRSETWFIGHQKISWLRISLDLYSTDCANCSDASWPSKDCERYLHTDQASERYTPFMDRKEENASAEKRRWTCTLSSTISQFGFVHSSSPGSHTSNKQWKCPPRTTSWWWRPNHRARLVII